MSMEKLWITQNGPEGPFRSQKMPKISEENRKEKLTI